MSRNKNVVSARFGATLMNSPKFWRAEAQGQTLEDQIGPDVAITSADLVGRRIVIQVSFSDWDSAVDMMLLQWGATADLDIRSEKLLADDPGAADIGLVFNDRAVCVSVQIDAQHAEVGSHVATFIMFSTTGGQGVGAAGAGATKAEFNITELS